MHNYFSLQWEWQGELAVQNRQTTSRDSVASAWGHNLMDNSFVNEYLMKDGRGGQTWISILILVTVCQAIISDRIFPKPEKLNCLIATWDKRILKNIPRAWSGRAVIGWQVAWLDRYWSGSRRCQTRAVVAYIKVLRLLPCFCAPVLQSYCLSTCRTQQQYLLNGCMYFYIKYLLLNVMN